MINNSNNYNDIIDLPHYISPYRPTMSMHDRAAQFAPFAALTGYDDAIQETQRITLEKPSLDEYELDRLNAKLNYVLKNNLDIEIIFFVKDEHKAGGHYHNVYGKIKHIDEVYKYITMHNCLKIAILNIIDIR